METQLQIKNQKIINTVIKSIEKLQWTDCIEANINWELLERALQDLKHTI